MPKRLTITGRIKRAKTKEARAKALTDWIESWDEDQNQVQKNLEIGLRTNNFDLLCRAVGQNKAIREKKMTALVGIFNTLIEEPSKDA